MSPVPLPCLFSWDLQEGFPWEPSASLPGVLSPAQWVTEGLGSSQEQTCRQQGHPGSSGNNAKANLPCSAFPQGILEPLGMQRREADLSDITCGEEVSISLPGGGRSPVPFQCAAGHGHSQEGAQQLEVSYKSFLVLWSVQSRDCRAQAEGENTKSHTGFSSMKQFHECTLDLPNYKSLATMHMNSVCNSFFLWNNLINSSPQIVQKSGGFTVRGKSPGLFSIVTTALLLIKTHVQWQCTPIKPSKPILAPNLVLSS